MSQSAKHGRILLVMQALALSTVLGSTTLDGAVDADEPDDQKVAQFQKRLADQYLSLERRLLERAELESSGNTQRAGLLRQTYARGRQLQLQKRLRLSAELIAQGELARASQQQKLLQRDLKTLLELLLSDGRTDRMKQEKERVRSYIRGVERLLRMQRSVLGRTESGDALDRLAKDEKRVAKNTQDLLGTMRKQEGTEGQPSTSSGDDRSNSEADDKSNEGDEPPDPPDPAADASDEADGSRPSAENESPSPESQAGKPIDPSDKLAPGDTPPDGEPSQSDATPSPGQPDPAAPAPAGSAPPPSSEDAPSSDPSKEANQDRQRKFPGQKALEKALQRMQQAAKALEQAKRENAAERERAAQQMLEVAKAELKRILRQLREKEIEQVLAKLEERLSRMLERQLRINEGTRGLPLPPPDQSAPARETVVQASKLALQQRQNVTEVDKALILLKEEGSSMVFPEVIAQIRDDMTQVAKRLDVTRIDQLTFSIQDDIVLALEELIGTLKAELKKRKDEDTAKPDAPMPGQPGQQEEPLVRALAELKMLRSLQLRVNSRTDAASRQLQNPDDPVGQATAQELVESLRRLSLRQSRLHHIARDIVIGKNQ